MLRLRESQFLICPILEHVPEQISRRILLIRKCRFPNMFRFKNYQLVGGVSVVGKGAGSAGLATSKHDVL